MATQKNTNVPLLISVICFIVGLIIGAWGWDKNESTILERTHGAVAMIIIGCTLIIGGLIGMFVIGGRVNRN